MKKNMVIVDGDPASFQGSRWGSYLLQYAYVIMKYLYTSIHAIF